MSLQPPFFLLLREPPLLALARVLSSVISAGAEWSHFLMTLKLLSLSNTVGGLDPSFLFDSSRCARVDRIELHSCLTVVVVRLDAGGRSLVSLLYFDDSQQRRACSVLPD